jgi:hypothetical protein
MTYQKHLLMGLVALLPAAGQAATLLDENFNELTPQLTAFSVGPFSAINGTNVDIVGGGLFGYLCVAPAAGNCIDMVGSGGNSFGQLRSNSAFTLEPGVSYFLSFDLIGSQRGVTASTMVTFGPYSKTFTLASGDDSSGIVADALVTVSAPTMAFLTFSETSGAVNIGNLLDNVLITSSSGTSVPEPATLALLSLGLFGIGLARRRPAH